MTRQTQCRHEVTRFHSVQRLGKQPPIELRHCVLCHSTVAVPMAEQAVGAGVAASH